MCNMRRMRRVLNNKRYSIHMIIMLQHPTFLTLFQLNDAMKRHEAYFF